MNWFNNYYGIFHILYQISVLPRAKQFEQSHVTCVLDVLHISFERIGDKQHNNPMFRSSQVLQNFWRLKYFFFNHKLISHQNDKKKTLNRLHSLIYQCLKIPGYISLDTSGTPVACGSPGGSCGSPCGSSTSYPYLDPRIWFCQLHVVSRWFINLFSVSGPQDMVLLVACGSQGRIQGGYFTLVAPPRHPQGVLQHPLEVCREKILWGQILGKVRYLTI